MTSREYLLNQAQFCRRAAAEAVDGFIASELMSLARKFEQNARQIFTGEPAICMAVTKPN